MGSYVCNMAVTNARVLGGVGAQDRVLGRWNRNFDRRTKAFSKSSSGWLAIVSTVRKK
jgi:hypothetical protein